MGRGIPFALAALGMAGCADAPDRDAEPVAAAATPQAYPSVASAARALASDAEPTSAEQDFAEAVSAVALSVSGDHPDAVSASPDDVFVPLRKAGLAGPSFDGEADYAAWISPRRPLRFFGHSVTKVIAEEMRNGFIGCCVNTGVTLMLRADGDRADLQQFADESGCKLEPVDDDAGTTDSSATKDRDGLLVLSCHERDMME